mmetsp:Transcript_3318/g.8970  ORF Transcript_3318/g.8970 Transcript_3318/m.8970 type:complete len:225 (+) Transcript_3318:542-1216(+)
MLDGPLRAERVGDLLEMQDRGLTHGVDRVAQAREEEGLQLRLEHVDAEEARQLGHLLDDALADAPVVVHDEVLNCVEQRVHEAVHAENFADEACMRNHVEAHVVEFILHEVGDEAQKLALRHVAPEDLGDRSQHLGQGGAHRLGRVEAQGAELRQDVDLQLVAGERLLQQEAGLDDAHRLLPDLLLPVPHELNEGLHEVGGRDLGPKRRAELVEVLRHRQAHAP